MNKLAGIIIMIPGAVFFGLYFPETVPWTGIACGVVGMYIYTMEPEKK